MASTTQIIDSIRQVVLQLEGPYKWYIIAGVVIILTAIITKVIFKTLKWFIIIVLLAILAGALIFFISNFASQIGARV